MAVSISQKAAFNQSENIFFRGEDVVFTVHLHDPSGYLKTAAAVDYMWDFRDGNQLVTHRTVTTHTYSTLGSMSVSLVVEAAFPVECPPPAMTSTPRSSTFPPKTGKRKRHVLCICKEGDDQSRQQNQCWYWYRGTLTLFLETQGADEV